MLPVGTPVRVLPGPHVRDYIGYLAVVIPVPEWDREVVRTWVQLCIERRHLGAPIAWYDEQYLEHGTPEIIAAYTAYLMGVPCS